MGKKILLGEKVTVMLYSIDKRTIHRDRYETYSYRYKNIGHIFH